MRILMVDPLPSTLPYDRELCMALAAEGHEVRLMSNAWSEDPPNWTPAVQHVTMKVRNVFAPRGLTGLVQRLITASTYIMYAVDIHAVWREAVAYKPDVIHFQWCLAPVADLLVLQRLSKGIPTVHTVHDLKPFNGEPVSSYSLIAGGRLLKSFDRLIVHTREAQAALKNRGIPETRTVVVPHGPLNVRRKMIGSRSKVARGAHVTILLFGIMRAYKGIDILIRAASLLDPDVRSMCQIHVVGRPDMDVQQLNDLRIQLNVQRFVEIVPRFIPDEEIEELFNDADVFVFPYREIDASGVFTLALQFGRPIIASKIGIFEEYIADRTNGILIERGSPAELAEAITYLVQNSGEREKMGAQMQETWRRFPTWASIARETTRVYEQASLNRRDHSA